MRAVMLTPDEGFLDRRIAQEAVSLAGAGWTVDIEPIADPTLAFDGNLPPTVRLRSVPGPTPAPSRARRVLRTARRVVRQVAPQFDRQVEALRYRTGDRAGALADTHIDRLASEPFDLIVAHDAPVFPLAARLKERRRCPLICDLHEIFAEQDEHFTSDTARAYWRGVEGIGLVAADGILCVNEAVADYARSTHQPTADCVVVLNSVPFVEAGSLTRHSIRDLYPIPPGHRILLFAGSLRPHANLETLIAGFGEAHLDGWVLALLGAGPLEEALRGQVDRLALGDRVFLGRRVPQRDLIAVAASADIGVLPYRPVGLNHEIATPNKLFEYIQARLPIATSRLPMIARIVEANRNGAFVDYTSGATTADGLRRFVEGPFTRISSGELDAAARAVSWEVDEGRFLGLVDRVVPTPASPATASPPR